MATSQRIMMTAQSQQNVRSHVTMVSAGFGAVCRSSGSFATSQTRLLSRAWMPVTASRPAVEIMTTSGSWP
jgi:hypothetical protein